MQDKTEFWKWRITEEVLILKSASETDGTKFIFEKKC